jgi:hypothetical protein
MPSTREEWPRRRRLVCDFAGFGTGLLGLASGFNRPSIANMRTLDLVHLLATGAGLGVGLAALVLYFVRRGSG